ncbi:TolC family protein [Thermoleptolyngbya sp. C42_A2020_037]|uniref:TolC family protein n=1 Tax=Thermoleptolyngbya sp. C42_A2020_037 TaxID=2747799 RepID=UPI0025F4745A|nr:TolC family protein [Thermoleptolyngbya sp. C42_A2020_037]
MRSLSIFLSATVSVTATLFSAEAIRAEAQLPSQVSPETSSGSAPDGGETSQALAPSLSVRPALARRRQQADRAADWEILAEQVGGRRGASGNRDASEINGTMAVAQPAEPQKAIARLAAGNRLDDEGRSPAATTSETPLQVAQTEPVPFPPAADPEPAPAQPIAPAEVPATPAEPDTEARPLQPITNTFTDGFPENLEPRPNPLLFPTRPEEVRTGEPQPITLQQAIELARRNNRQLQIAELELEQARAQLQEARAANLPTAQLGADLTFTENTDRPQPSIFNPNPPQESDITTSLGGSVRIDYDLFTSGQRSATIRAAEGQVRLRELEVERLSEQLRLDVSNDFYDVQEADENVRIAQDTVRQAEQSLRDALALEQAGVGTRFDVLQAQVELANAQQELVQALSDQQTNRRRLVRRLDLSQTVNLVAADAVAPAEDWTLSLEESIVLAYKNRAELEQQLVQRDIAQRQRRAALATLGPQVALFGQYQFENPTNDQNSDFRDIYQFGVRASMTLFDGGRARAQARQQELNMAIAEASFADNRDAIRLEVEQSFYSLQANRTNISTAEAGVEQARESLRLARLRFQAGVGTQTEVLQAQTDLTRAEANLVRAVLGYNRSLVALQRAISNLPDGYLAEDPLGRGDRIRNTR